jgi:hypothetical protein
MIEKIDRIGPDAISAACIGPRLWFKIPHPRIIDPNNNNIIPNIKMFSFLFIRLIII